MAQRKRVRLIPERLKVRVLPPQPYKFPLGVVRFHKRVGDVGSVKARLRHIGSIPTARVHRGTAFKRACDVWSIPGEVWCKRPQDGKHTPGRESSILSPLSKNIEGDIYEEQIKCNFNRNSCVAFCHSAVSPNTKM